MGPVAATVMHTGRRTHGRMDGNRALLGMQLGSKVLIGGKRSRRIRLGVGPAAMPATVFTDTQVLGQTMAQQPTTLGVLGQVP
mmetsp:Transcript_60326/g.116351  ORF Transcript_60326/g.116351 Transcript_60326/m.116351 type:complete len:83 (+) Transcript_60326:849-1097(+)